MTESAWGVDHAGNPRHACDSCGFSGQPISTIGGGETKDRKGPMLGVVLACPACQKEFPTVEQLRAAGILPQLAAAPTSVRTDVAPEPVEPPYLALQRNALARPAQAVPQNDNPLGQVLPDEVPRRGRRASVDNEPVPVATITTSDLLGIARERLAEIDAKLVEAEQLRAERRVLVRMLAADAPKKAKVEVIIGTVPPVPDATPEQLRAAGVPAQPAEATKEEPPPAPPKRSNARRLRAV